MTAVPRIQVHLFAAAAAELGTDQCEVGASTVAEALEALGAGASDTARQVLGRSSVLVNAVACTDHDQPLDEGDRLDVLPPFAGG